MINHLDGIRYGLKGSETMAINATDMLLYSIPKCNENKIAIYSPQGNITYLQYIEYVNEYEKRMLQIYEGKSIKVGILLEDCLEFAYLFWACMKIGIIPILINNKFTLQTIEQCVDSICLENVIVKNNKKLEFYFQKCGFERFATFNEIAFLRRRDYDCKQENEIEESIAFGIFTSGSTDIPKCVLHTHRSIIKCPDLYYKQMIGVREDDIIYSASKMMHTYGLGNTIFQTVGVRAAAIICADGSAYSVISNIQKYKPTILFAVPSIYKEILRISEKDKVNLSSLRLCFSAGEYLDPSIYKEFYYRFGCKIFDGLGNTEYLTTFITNTDTDYRVGSCGKCIPGFKAKIVDSDNFELENGKVGRLLIKGDIHLYGYYGESKKYSSKDYFDTENLCYIDAEKFIWFVGRNNILYKIKGKWVNPIEIEQLLSEFEEIDDVLVVADSRFELNRSILYIKCKEFYIEKIDKEKFFHKIRVFIKKNVEHYKCPTEFILVKCIPKGATGKKIRKLITVENHLGDEQ